jgi:hypothetical protein
MNILHKAKCIINNKPLPEYLRKPAVKKKTVKNPSDLERATFPKEIKTDH